MNEQNLIDFINQERKYKKINNKKLIYIFNKCLIKSIHDLISKFSYLKEDILLNSIAGIEMIKHIFVILVKYTNNIKLTIFFVERSILLFTEFIIMSRDTKIIEEICFIPDINDAISFCYKKTIGVINISSINSYRYTNFNTIGCIITNLYIKLLVELYDTTFLENINIIKELLEIEFIKISNKNKLILDYILIYINRILELEYHILEKIIILKICINIMEIYLFEFKSKTNDFNSFFDSLFNKIENSNISYDKNKPYTTYKLYIDLHETINNLNI